MAVMDDLKETVDGLRQEVRELREKVKDIIPFGKKNRDMPVRVAKPSEAEHPVMALQRATNQLFDQFFRDFAWPASGLGELPDQLYNQLAAGGLNLDIKETDDDLEVSAELPGMDKDDIEVILLGNRLTIKGEKKKEQESKDAGYYRMERSYGVFQRNVWLPCEVQPDKVEATYKKGVLFVKLAKSEKERALSSKIPVLPG